MEPLWILMRILAFVFAVVLSYILYRVTVGAYAKYVKSKDRAPWRSRQLGGYKRLPRREEVVDHDGDGDEDEGYHDAESFEIERSPRSSQKPLPERPLPDKPLPPVPVE